MKFSEILKLLRKEKKITQFQLSKNLNVTHGAIAMWETNKRQPDNETLIKIADYFNVTIDYLLGRSDEPTVRKDTEKEKAAVELTAEESKLLEIFRKLNVKNRMHVSAYAQVRLEDQESSTRPSWG